MNRHVLSFLLPPFAFLSLGAQQSARDTAKAETVVVTATRTPLTQSTLPVAVTIIEASELRLRGVTSVADALREVTSAYVAQIGSAGGQTSLFLRGGESKYVKVLIDGVAVNDPGGAYDFGPLTIDNVERIEVVRGPASVILGADAVTGVVNIITRSGVGKHHAEFAVRSGIAPRETMAGQTDPGSAQTLDATGAIYAGFDVGSYSIAAARHQATGLYAQNNHYLNNVFSGRVVFRPMEGGELRVSLRYNDDQFNYPTNSAGDIVDKNAYRVEDRTTLGVELDRRFSPTVRAVISLGSNLNDGGTDDEVDPPAGTSSFISQDKTRRRSAELRLHLLPLNNAVLTLGAQMEQQDQRSQYQSQSSFGPFNSQFKAARRNAGLYGEAILTPQPTTTFTVGARADHNQQFGDFGTYRVGVSWRPVEMLRVRGTAGSAFREPLFSENFSTGFVTGNPKLQPERSRSYDAGVDADLLGGKVRVSLTGFAQTFTNMIDYTGSTAACGYSYCNVASATANGIEAEVRAQLIESLAATLGGTVLKTRVQDPGFDATPGGLYHKGESLIRRPERTINLGLSYHAGPIAANTLVAMVGKRADRDFHFPATPVTLKAYNRIDAGVEYRLPPVRNAQSAVTLSGENLANVHYQNVFNFLAPRRTLTLGVRSSL